MKILPSISIVASSCVFVCPASADQPSPEFLRAIVAAQESAFDRLEPLTVVFEEQMIEFESDDDAEEVKTIHSETYCGDRVYVELKIEKKERISMRQA